jgi:hypothetical protein
MYHRSMSHLNLSCICMCNKLDYVQNRLCACDVISRRIGESFSRKASGITGLCVCVCGYPGACACAYVHVVLPIHHATRMRHIVTSFVALSVSITFFDIIS